MPKNRQWKRLLRDTENFTKNDISYLNFTMTDVMAQRGLLSAPASRQDIVSALLNDYGNSFGRGDASPSAYSPVPADKELPPPPPRSDSIARKPLPAALRMQAKFQLRGKQELLGFECKRWPLFVYIEWVVTSIRRATYHDLT